MFCNIRTTTDKKEIAYKLSKKLLENNYSPCIQIMNSIESQYLWKGKIRSTQEYRIDIKTLENLSEKVIMLIESIHNYEIPEIIKQSISVKNNKYKEWFLENTKK